MANDQEPDTPTSHHVPQPCQDYEAHIAVSAKEAARRLDTLFPRHTWPAGKVMDHVFYDVAQLLCIQGLPFNSPRLYIMLRLLGRPDVLNGFLDSGATDLCFPFNSQSLPSVLDQSVTRSAFLRRQWIVLSDSVPLEQGAQGEHQTFRSDDIIPFKARIHLSNGTRGVLDIVDSAVTGDLYVRKRFRKSYKKMETLLAEISTIKQLRHHHVVKLIGTYSDPVFDAFIISPVAHFNLSQYLAAVTEHPTPHRLSVLSTFFGCLTSGLAYLHAHSIRHATITPTTILIHGASPLYTTTSLTFSWADEALLLAHKPRLTIYTAPELHHDIPRNTSADIWSLGCIFAEILAVWAGRPADDLHDFLATHGSTNSSYALNPDAVDAYLALLLPATPVPWIRAMLAYAPAERPTAAAMQERILSTNNHGSRFVGWCCRPDTLRPHPPPTAATLLAACAANNLSAVRALWPTTAQGSRSWGSPSPRDNPKPTTPLATAAHAGALHVVEWLLQQPGVDVGERDAMGRTAVEWAAGEGRAECVEVLVGKGADVGDVGRGLLVGVGRAK